jgi:hypothetical protein
MYNLKKVIFKNAVKRLAKSQLSVWQNRSLAFKIANLPLKICVFKKAPSYLRFKKANFLRFQIVIFKSTVPKRSMFCDLV